MDSLIARNLLDSPWSSFRGRPSLPDAENSPPLMVKSWFDESTGDFALIVTDIVNVWTSQWLARSILSDAQKFAPDTDISRAAALIPFFKKSLFDDSVSSTPSASSSPIKVALVDSFSKSLSLEFTLGGRGDDFSFRWQLNLRPIEEVHFRSQPSSSIHLTLPCTSAVFLRDHLYMPKIATLSVLHKRTQPKLSHSQSFSQASSSSLSFCSSQSDSLESYEMQALLREPHFDYKSLSMPIHKRYYEIKDKIQQERQLEIERLEEERQQRMRQQRQAAEREIERKAAEEAATARRVAMEASQYESYASASSDYSEKFSSFQPSASTPSIPSTPSPVRPIPSASTIKPVAAASLPMNSSNSKVIDDDDEAGRELERKRKLDQAAAEAKKKAVKKKF